MCGRRQAEGFLKKPLCEKIWVTAQFEWKPTKNNERFANRTVSFKRTLYKLGLVNGPPSVIDASGHLKWPHTFFVSVRLWPH